MTLYNNSTLDKHGSEAHGLPTFEMGYGPEEAEELGRRMGSQDPT